MVEKAVPCMKEPTDPGAILQPEDWPLATNNDGSTTVSLEASLRVLSTIMYLNEQRRACRAVQAETP